MFVLNRQNWNSNQIRGIPQTVKIERGVLAYNQGSREQTAPNNSISFDF